MDVMGISPIQEPYHDAVLFVSWFGANVPIVVMEVFPCMPCKKTSGQTECCIDPKL